MQVTALCRHPLKAHGREALQRVNLIAGQSMPYDRTWAVAHDNARLDGDGWHSCRNFTRAASAPALQAITAELDEAQELLTLRHPDLDDLTFNPDREGDKLIQWVHPLMPEGRSMPVRILRLEGGRGYTDSNFASVSLFNAASHAAVESLAQHPLQRERWRGNIWFEGAPAWEEFDWIDRELKIGTARLVVKARIQRCKSTMANTDTGVRDVDTLRALQILGHQDFGVCLSVLESGEIAVGDTVEVL